MPGSGHPTILIERGTPTGSAHFPALTQGAAHFDGPGGSQTPDVVAEAISRTLLSPLANRGVNTAAERNAEDAVRAGRQALGDLLAVAPDTVIFGRSATALTFELSRTIAAGWRPGDEVIVTRLDHDANVRPWVIAAGRAKILAGLEPDKLLPSTDRVPERFELGTLPYELMAGTTAAIGFLADATPGDGTVRERLTRSMESIERHEDRLRGIIETALMALPGATVYSRARHRTPTLLVTFAGDDAADVSRHLAERGVNAPAGSFYAYETARHLGLGEAGGLRIGLAPYNDDNDVDRLIETLGSYFK